jgi:hypothetical protein
VRQYGNIRRSSARQCFPAKTCPAYLKRERIGKFCSARGKLFTPHSRTPTHAQVRFRRGGGGPGRVLAAPSLTVSGLPLLLGFLSGAGTLLSRLTMVSVPAAATASVTGLSAFAARFGCELRIL